MEEVRAEIDRIDQALGRSHRRALRLCRSRLAAQAVAGRGARAVAHPAGDRQGAGARGGEGPAARAGRGAVAADDRLVHPVRGGEAPPAARTTRARSTRVVPWTQRPKRSNLIEGDDRPVGGGDRHGGACPGHLQRQAVLGRLDRVRRRAQFPCEPGRCRHARHAAGDQRGLHRASDPHRARAEGEDQSQLGVRPEELFLPRPAAGLSDQPVQEPDRRRGRGHRRSAGRRARRRSASSGCISSRTRARACTTSTRNIPMSISTARAWR